MAFSFPVFKTKVEGHTERFRLEDPAERRKYFDLKARAEIEKLRDYLSAGNTFVGFLLGPKNSGKGTYTKLFMEAVGEEHVAHISVGDTVRNVHKEIKGDEDKKNKLAEFLSKRYRGFLEVDKVFDVILGRDTKNLLPTEVVLSLVEREIDRLGRKAIFIDGFPRNLDQISYSLYFRALIGYRDDPDFLVFIDVPDAVIDERMKYRVVCPKCQSPRNTKLLRTKEVGFDADKKTLYLICDNPNCSGFGVERLFAKEGDELGIGSIRERVENDKKVMAVLLNLQGVPKVYLRNTVPVNVAGEYIDDYEITPSYRYEYDEISRKIKVAEEPWMVKNDSRELAYSLLPAPVAVALIKQTSQVLGL